MKKHVEWLYDELPRLTDAKVLSPAAADALRQHYGAVAPRSGRSLAITICSILGSVMIGAGVILLLAHNWEDLARPARLILALAPLVAAQAAGLWGLRKGQRSVAWREGVAALQFFGVGASIALVGQTYHIPGDPGAFLLTWMLLALPTVYLLDASLPALLYLAGITTWAGYEQSAAGQAVLFWPLVALAVPHVWKHTRDDPHAQRASLLGWGFVLCISIGLGIAMEKALPGIWILLYSTLFAILYLAGSYWFSDVSSLARRPAYALGALAIPALSFVLTFEEVWEEIGWYYCRHGARFHKWAAAADYLLVAVLLVGWAGLIVQALRRDEKERLAIAALPAVAIAGFAATTLSEAELPAMILFNAYTLVLGIGSILSGVRRLRVGTVNWGMLILAAVITARFFDTEMSFLVRGLVFIAMGLGFLGANLLMARHVKRGAP